MSIFNEQEISQCIGCGCDDMHACLDENTEDACSWIRIDREQGLGVCSACPEQVDLWDKGDREMKVPG